MGEALLLRLPSIPDNVPVVRHAVRGMLEGRAIPETVAGDVLLAVTEACTNIVQHAYAGCDGDRLGEMEITADWQDPDELFVVVRDHGRGFAPRVDSPGLGLGLPVIAALTRRLELQEPPGGGTEVVMTFAVAPASR
jgi:serine/threonine-protein kinase RsbW